MSSLRFEKFYAEHLDAVRLQDTQREDRGVLISREVGEAAAQHLAFSAWVHERCLGCAGVIPVWQGRAQAWAFLSGDIGLHMTACTRFVRHMLDMHPADRIEATVLDGFSAGHRWMGLLGFECETPKGMRKYDPAGRRMMLYARVRE